MLPLVAVLAFALLSMGALAVDLGAAAAQQNRLQSAAEAMAMGAHHQERRLRLALLRDEDDVNENGNATAASINCDDFSLTGCSEEIDLAADAYGERLADLILNSETVAADRNPTVNLGPGAALADVESIGSGAAEGSELVGALPEGVEDCADGCWGALVRQAMPLLFGQASMLGFSEGESLRDLQAAREDGQGFVGDGTPVAGSLRTRGIPIRAISAVDVMPVVAIGRAHDASAEESDLFRPIGRAPFTLEFEAWADGTFEPGSSQILTVEGLSLLPATADADSGQAEAPAVGRIIVGADQGLRAGETMTTQPGVVAESLPGVDPEWMYVPLTMPTGQDDALPMVVGFGLVRAQSAADGETLTVERSPSHVQFALGNASASARSLSRSSDIGALLSMHAQDDRIRSQVLQAAVPR